MQHPIQLSNVALSLKDAIREAHKTPEIPYPWHGLEQICDRCEGGRLPLIGYGSLISQLSARRTLQHSHVDAMFPVQAYGVRRIFNYRMPLNALSHWGTSPESAHVAALNVRLTWAEEDSVNGVVIAIDKRDLPQLRQREGGYSIATVPYRRWADHEKAHIHGLAYILSDPRANAANEALSPVIGYLEMCRDACNRFGQEFVDEFNRTTFLSDGKTPLLNHVSGLGG